MTLAVLDIANHTVKMCIHIEIIKFHKRRTMFREKHVSYINVTMITNKRKIVSMRYNELYLSAEESNKAFYMVRLQLQDNGTIGTGPRDVIIRLMPSLDILMQ